MFTSANSHRCLILGALAGLFVALLAVAGLLCCLCTAGGLIGWAAIHPTPTPSPTPTPPVANLPIDQTPTPASATTARHLRIFTELWQIVHDEYLYPDYNGADWDAIGQEYRARIEAGMSDEEFWAAMDEMLIELNDDHSVFLPPSGVTDEDRMLSGELDYVGVGVYTSVPLELEKQYAVVLLVLPGSPAEAADVRPHDRILAVDGQLACCDAFGYDYLYLLAGPGGSEVELRVQTPGKSPRTVTVTRSHVQSPLPVETRLLDGDVGYILIPTLWDDTIVDRVRWAIEELMLTPGELTGLILDLRVNSGGSDTALRGLLELFTGGEVGYFVGRHGQEPLHVTGINVGGSQSIPLVILVGRETASFAEVLGGVLQEIGRAQIVGRTTLGNIETTFGYDFEDGSRAWLAQETFRPPGGTDWEKTGIIPDVEILLDWDEFTAEDDPQLEAALELLRR